MKAWFLKGANEFEMREVEEPTLLPECVLVEVMTCQASVTDANGARLMGPMGRDNAKKIEKYGETRCTGHELVGRIIAVNEGSNYKVGDIISSLPRMICGKCPACLSGDVRHCEKTGQILGGHIPSVMQERINIAEGSIVKVPDNLSVKEAANLQPLSDTVAAIKVTSFKPGMKCAIFGVGCLGMNIMQLLNAQGAAMTIAVDVKPEICKIAEKYGATYVINAKDEDPVKKIMELTNGEGVDIVFDCCGGNPDLGLAGTDAIVPEITVLKKEGELAVLCIYDEVINFPIGMLRKKNIKMSFAGAATPEDMAYGARLISEGKLHVEDMVTHTVEGIENVPKMFEITANKLKYGALNPCQCHIKD